MASGIIAMTTFSTIAVTLGVLVGIGACEPNATKAPSRAFFVFGDSLVDSGNNNFLATIARADYPPYGLDYPGHQATGRFSNGLNFPDLLAESMGLEQPVAYLDPQITTDKLLNGANFASAGVGILDDTGFQFANIVKINRQLELFKEYQVRVSKVMGKDETKKLVDRAIVLITLGGNDFVNNYFLLPFSARRSQYALPAYCMFLVAEYKKILKKLHKLGGRRILVTGTGPLGCVPAELAMYMSPDGQCIEEQQRAASIFNPLLSKMVQDLNDESDSDTFVFSNAFDLNMGLITDPQKFGFASSKMACCGQGLYNGIGLCTPLSSLCSNRDAFVFWDPFHPSEKALRLIVSHMMNASSKYMNPMNLSTIMALDSRN